MRNNLRFALYVTTAFACIVAYSSFVNGQLLRPAKNRQAIRSSSSSQKPSAGRKALGDEVVSGDRTAMTVSKISTRSKTKTTSLGKTSDAKINRSSNTKITANATSTSLLENVGVQASLDRAGFSPGVIDGTVGGKTRVGIKIFQTAYGLPATGQLDDATRQALTMSATTPATIDYVITEQDLKDVGPCPTGWKEKSQQDKLGFKSIDALVAFHGHCSQQLLAKLNPGMKAQTLKAGDILKIPNVTPAFTAKKAAVVEIDFDAKTITPRDATGKPLGLFHCSIAKDKQNRPSGPCTVAGIVANPKYLFKPESWPEVKNVKENLIIPPGPTNPVGLCWIGLSLKGYGIHGTPEPENIGKTGSHGCFRMTNWDVLRLAEMLDAGNEIRFVESTPRMARR